MMLRNNEKGKIKMADNNANRKYYDAQIVKIEAVEHRFNRPNAFELRAEVTLFNADKSIKGRAEVFMEVSMEYGKGNNASKTQWEITKETLHALGLEGEDISEPRLATLVNRPCRICENVTDKGTNYYFTTNRPVTVIKDANERLRAMMAGGMSAPSASPFGNAAAPIAQAPNPFE